jgi:hypothetical protein
VAGGSVAESVCAVGDSLTDLDFLEAVLREYLDEWVPHAKIMTRSFNERGCGMTVNSRASELRTERGLNVDCKTERAWNPETQMYSGRVQSFYMLRTETEREVIPTRRAEASALEGAAGISAPAVQAEAASRSVSVSSGALTQPGGEGEPTPGSVSAGSPSTPPPSLPSGVRPRPEEGHEGAVREAGALPAPLFEMAERPAWG